MGKYHNAVDSSYFADPSKKEALLELVKNPAVLVEADDQPKLFTPGYEEVLFEYLSHHSLYEANQHFLFEKRNEKVLDFFIEHWVLGSIYEAKLCSPEYRGKWLFKYMEHHHFADLNNELLLFNEGMDEYRRFYISRTDFHCQKAEQKLFEPEYKEDLRLYKEMGRRFF